MDKTIKLKKNNSKKYKVKTICDSKVYARESDNSHPQSLYYMILWKNYPKEENTWKSTLAMLHFYKIINTFYHDYPEKAIITFMPINSVLPIAKPMTKFKASNLKPKYNWLAKTNGTSKCTKKSWIFSFYLVFGPVSIVSKSFTFSHILRVFRFSR